MNPKLSSSSFMIIPLSSLLLFLSIVFNVNYVTVAIGVVQKTCKKCENKDPNIDYNFCVSSFQADPGSDSSDLHRLGAISLSLIGSNVSNSAGYVKRLLQKKEMDSYRKARLSDCLELYSDAIVTVEEGKKAYRAKRYDDADIKMSSVMDAARICEDGFGEKDGFSSPLTKRNKDTFQLTAIALSIINMHP